jgi:hypothetical protein
MLISVKEYRHIQIQNFPQKFSIGIRQLHDNRKREGLKNGKQEQEHMGVFMCHNTIPKAFGTPLARQEPSDYALLDPMAFPVSRDLQAACPMHNT